MGLRGFGSDNFSGVLPEVFKALEESAFGHQHSYRGRQIHGKKPSKISNKYSEMILTCISFIMEQGANILSLSAFTHSYNAIICAETAHINVDECGGYRENKPAASC